MRQMLEQLIEGRDLSSAQARELFEAIMSGQLEPALIAAVLTGLAAALLAQSDISSGLADIAAAAAWAHATAGDLAARQGERGLIAADLLLELRTCLNP